MTSALNLYDVFLESLFMREQSAEELDEMLDDPDVRWTALERAQMRNSWMQAQTRQKRTHQAVDLFTHKLAQATADTITPRVVDAVSLRLADALDAFWNAALGHVRSDTYAEPGTFGTIAAMASGFSAVSHHLRQAVVPDGDGTCCGICTPPCREVKGETNGN